MHLRKPDPDRSILAAVYVGAASLAAFAFGQSYKHIYDLGRLHEQDGWTARLLPLSVDVVIVVASLILILQGRSDEQPDDLAKWLPRAMLYVGIAATIGANLLYGLPYGWETAGISTWPGAVFAGTVEVVMVAVRPVQRTAVKRTVIPAGQPLVPATVAEAAQAAFAASMQAGNPLSGYQLSQRFGLKRSQADKLVAASKAAMNGSGHA